MIALRIPTYHVYARTRSRQKLGCCRARVTGHWLTVGRPAAGTSGSHTRCKHARHLRCVRSPCIADMLCMPSTSTVARCHRTAERHDDNDRDEDERHDAEDREHDERSQRVRARSRLPLSRAKAHAHARCQAPLSKTRTLPTPRWPWNDHPFLTPNMSPQLAGPIERSVDLRQRGS